jgi:2'-5' RNA ligase
MIWGIIKDEQGLSELYRRLVTNYRSLSFKVHPARPRLTPHLTLARFNAFDIRGWESEGLPDISEHIHLPFTAGSIEIMESKLSRGGSKFSVLQSIRLEAR